MTQPVDPQDRLAAAPAPLAQEPAPEQLKSVMGAGRIFKAAFYSWEGLRAAWAHEAAFRQDLMLIAVHLAFVFFVPLSAGWRAGLVAWALGLLAAEITNSAIEAVVDLVCQGQRHELAKRAKDMGSALVALWLAIGGALWVGAVWPLIFH